MLAERVELAVHVHVRPAQAPQQAISSEPQNQQATSKLSDAHPEPPQDIHHLLQEGLFESEADQPEPPSEPSRQPHECELQQHAQMQLSKSNQPA